MTKNEILRGREGERERGREGERERGREGERERGRDICNSCRQKYINRL
jgi:hypothetical protein